MWKINLLQGVPMSTRRYIQIGGVINLLFVMFHLSFWKIFNWQQDLVTISADNRAIMQVLNIHTAYVLLIFAILSFVFSEEIVSSKLGRFIALAVAAFWILRAMNQIIFWGAIEIGSWVAFLVCLVISLLYIVPIFRLRRVKT